MRNKNTQSGITLIALVVTIVVLLILAGITIAFVLSDGGIFQSAKDAKEQQAVATIRDCVGQINGVIAAKYWANIASGETDVEATIQLVKGDEEADADPDHKVSAQSFFPKNNDDGYQYTVVGVYGSAKTTGTDGMIKGSYFTVDIDGDERADYDVTFDENGAVRVETYVVPV